MTGGRAINSVHVKVASSWDNLDANGLCLRQNTLAQTLQTQSREPRLAVLDLGDLVDVLQRDRAAGLMARVHGTAQAALSGLDVGRVQEEIGGGRSAEVEGKGSVGADSDARRNGNAGVDVCSASVEFLFRPLVSRGWVRWMT